MLIVLVVLLFLAAVWDVYRGRIPNALVIIGCFHGTIRLLLLGKVLSFIPGIIIPVIILFPLYKIGVMGAGDIKILSMLGFYFPVMEVLFCIFMSFLLGAFVSIICLVRNENLSERMAYLFCYLKDCFCQGHLRYYYLDSKGKTISGSEYDKSKIHFALPIFISVLLHIGGVF